MSICMYALSIQRVRSSLLPLHITRRVLFLNSTPIRKNPSKNPSHTRRVDATGFALTRRVDATGMRRVNATGCFSRHGVSLQGDQSAAQVHDMVEHASCLAVPLKSSRLGPANLPQVYPP